MAIPPLYGPVRALVIALSAIAALAAASWAARPFLQDHDAWRWTVAADAPLEGATVNGIIRERAPALRIAAAPNRPISIISGPVALHAGHYAAVDITTAAVGPPADVDLRCFWQEHGAKSFRVAAARVRLEREMRTFRIPLDANPYWRGRVSRIGVQWAGAPDDVRFDGLSLSPVPRRDRPALALKQLLAPQALDNTSINYLVGPAILGHGLNYYAAAIVVCLAATYLLIALLRRMPLRPAVPLAALLAVWLICDGLSTAALTRQIADEARLLRPAADPAAELYGRELAALRDLIREHVPPGATFAVASDDDYYPWHRLAYWLMPDRICLPPDRAGQADFVAVYYSSAPPASVEPVAAISQQVYLARRVRP